MNKRGMELSLILQLVLWLVLLVIAFYLVKHFIVGGGTSVVPSDALG